jgi:hypothetical protein
MNKYVNMYYVHDLYMNINTDMKVYVEMDKQHEHKRELT